VDGRRRDRPRGAADPGDPAVAALDPADHGADRGQPDPDAVADRPAAADPRGARHLAHGARGGADLRLDPHRHHVALHRHDAADRALRRHHALPGRLGLEPRLLLRGDGAALALGAAFRLRAGLGRRITDVERPSAIACEGP